MVKTLVAKYVDAQVCTTERSRKWVANIMLTISIPLLVASGFASWRISVNRHHIDGSLASINVLSETGKAPVVVVNNDGEILTWTKNAEDIFGYTASEVVGQSVHMLMPKSLREHYMQLQDIVAKALLDKPLTVRLHCHGLTKANKRVELYYLIRTVPHKDFGKITIVMMDRKKDILEIEALDPNNIEVPK